MLEIERRGNMPCLYAHHTFGQKVRGLLPEEMQECIATYEEQFNLGLQGPDYLFFFLPLHKNRVNQLGHRIHKKSCAFYLHKILPMAVKKGCYSPECAYLLGFMCHFMLDSRCHPCVNQQVQVTGTDHVDLEGEFDKYLMWKDGEDPETYPLWKHIPTDRLTVDTLEAAYPWAGRGQIRMSLNSFKFCKWILTAKNPVRKQCLIFFMKLTGLYEKLAGHYLWGEAKKGTGETVRMFYELYKGEIRPAAEMDILLWNMIRNESKYKIPSRLRVNFSGK